MSSRHSKTTPTKRARKPKAKTVTHFPKKGGPLVYKGTHHKFASQLAKYIRPPVLSDYVKALQYPFTYPAPKLGVGTWTSTKKYTAWRHITPVVAGAGNTCFAINFQPWSPRQMVGMTIMNNPAPAIISGGPVYYDAANIAQISSQTQSGRVISAALRVIVRYPATSLGGTAGMMHVPDDSQTNFTNQSILNISELSSFQPLSSGNGAIGGEVHYRPADPTDFEMTTDAAGQPIPPNVASHNLICCGSGFPALSDWSVEIYAIVHYETLAGFDTAGEDDDEPGLLGGQATIDRLAANQTTLDSAVIPSISLLDSLEHGLNHISRMRGRGRSMFGSPTLSTSSGSATTPDSSPIVPSSLTPSPVQRSVNTVPPINNHQLQHNSNYVLVPQYCPEGIQNKQY
jgi:hypothetical protein